MRFMDIFFPHDERAALKELIVSSVHYNDFWLVCIDLFMDRIIPNRISGYI